MCVAAFGFEVWLIKLSCCHRDEGIWRGGVEIIEASTALVAQEVIYAVVAASDSVAVSSLTEDLANFMSVQAATALRCLGCD